MSPSRQDSKVQLRQVYSRSDCALLALNRLAARTLGFPYGEDLLAGTANLRCSPWYSRSPDREADTRCETASNRCSRPMGGNPAVELPACRSGTTAGT